MLIQSKPFRYLAVILAAAVCLAAFLPQTAEVAFAEDVGTSGETSINYPPPLTDPELESGVDSPVEPANDVGAEPANDESETGALDVPDATAPLEIVSTAAAGTLEIGAESGLDLASNHSGTGWTWTAATATLALGADYTEEAVRFRNNAPVTISATGEVAVESDSYGTIWSEGALTLTVTGGGTLNVTGSEGAIYVEGALTVTGGGTLNVTADNYYPAAINVNGNITFTGSTVVNIYGAPLWYSPDLSHLRSMLDESAYTVGTITVDGGSVLNIVYLSEYWTMDLIGNLVNNGTITYNGKTSEEILVEQANYLANEIRAAYDGELTAEVEGTTVTVTGTVVDADEPLELNIPPGVEVVWKASLTSVENYSDNPFYYPYGGPYLLFVLVSDNAAFTLASG
ncbi:MAG: carbohydrate-binding domain-containing protein, partial [Clostridiales Family XIII bacterium]|nr:carbohydrate-binding domain-containing protein [Clostridiales Family XIII bacterium]